MHQRKEHMTRLAKSTPGERGECQTGRKVKRTERLGAKAGNHGPKGQSRERVLDAPVWTRKAGPCSSYTRP